MFLYEVIHIFNTVEMVDREEVISESRGSYARTRVFKKNSHTETHHR